MLKNLKFIKFIFVMILLIGCKDSKVKSENGKKDTIKVMDDEALFRPNFHFTPKQHWMNDPNGMFYFNKTYHLYFQYYPDGNTWGPMHWGHTTSKDLVTWQEQPIALFPDKNGYIFSGSAVVDTKNSSGFGKDGKTPIVSIFTYHNPEIEKSGKVEIESQAIAYSLDDGFNWKKYGKNPVIKNPGLKDFRDPKVSWDAIHNQWNLVLAAGDKDQFYRSNNLKDWEYLSDFGKSIGAHDGVWECPDFFKMKVEDSNEIKWVLIQSVGTGAPNGGSGTQYFIGDFDGVKFTLDSSFEKDIEKYGPAWLDYGRDNYAGVTWSNIPHADGRVLFLGWMSNWAYAEKVPTTKWRSSMTFPRELKLIKNKSTYKITSLPVKELANYISKTIKKDSLLINNSTEIINKSTIDFTKCEIQFNLNNLEKKKYTFVLQNAAGNELKFGIDLTKNYYFIDRTNAGFTNFSKKFATSISKAPIKNTNSKNFKIRILLDKTSIELFFNDGATIFTEIFFLPKPFETFSAYADNSNFYIENLVVNQLNFK